MIFWFTGLSGVGKTTLGMRLVAALNRMGRKVVFLDGDELRRVSRNSDFSAQGRKRNVDLAQWFAKRTHEAGTDAVVAVVSPFRGQRESFKAKLNRKGRVLLEFYVHRSTITNNPKDGVDYEEPKRDYVDIVTDGSVDESFKRVLSAVSETL